MENILGLIRLRIKKGTNLIPRDSRTSDPYVVLTMAEQVCYNNNNNKPFSFFFLVFP
jgi:Ca2+-dependent lipid-binding protein